jgi:hypothetical protein
VDVVALVFVFELFVLDSQLLNLIVFSLLLCFRLLDLQLGFNLCLESQTLSMTISMADSLVERDCCPALLKSFFQDLVFIPLRINKLSRLREEKVSFCKGHNCKTMVDLELFKLVLRILKQTFYFVEVLVLLVVRNCQKLLDISFATYASVSFEVVEDPTLGEHSDSSVKVEVENEVA